MANPVAFPNRPFNLRTSTWTLSQDIAGNASRLRTQIWIDKTGYSPTSSGGPAARSLRIDSVVVKSDSTPGFDFTGAGPWLILDHTYWVTHGSDGTKTVQVRADATYDLLGSAITTMNYTPAAINRASIPSFNPSSSLTTGTSTEIRTHRTSTAHTHDITWHFGGTSGTVVTGLATDYNWTPNASMFNRPTLVDKTSASGYIRTVTKNGSTVIGTVDTSFTLTLANNSTGQPSWSSVVAEEGVTSPAINTLVGKLVQGLSRVKGTINGASGVQGSTITAKKFTYSGTTVNVPGTTATAPGAITATGTVTVNFEITDTRGRKKTGSDTVDVLPYLTPKATNIKVYRGANTGTTPDPNGTRMVVSLNASAHSLVNSTQRNRLTVRVYTSPPGAATWTLRGTPISNSTTLSQGITVAYGAVGDYPVTNSYDVKIEVEDVFTGTTRATYLGELATGGIFQHWSTGMGVGKFWQQGMLDVGGDIYANAANGGTGAIRADGLVYSGGTELAKIDRAASETAIGMVERATTAEVQAGTDTTRYVSPAGLASRTATTARTGLVELATQAEVNAGTDTTRAITPAYLRHSSNLPFATAAGRVSNGSAVNNGTGRTIAVTLPTSRFNVAPIVQVTSRESARLNVAVLADETTTGFNVRQDNWSGANATGQTGFQWWAIQMTSSAAAG